MDAGRVERERALSAAKYSIGRIGALVAEESIQMHGGIGMTWELPLSHYAKRLVMIDHQLGDEDHHLERFIALGRRMSAADTPLLQRREGAVLVLSNNNPAARNALSPEFYAALTEALAAGRGRPGRRRDRADGRGRPFLLGRRPAPAGQAPRTAHGGAPRQARRPARPVRAVRDCRKPVIAAVEGAAAGAGLSLALACDMLVAAAMRSFSVAYVKVGLTPDGGATAFLAEFVSRQVLTELCLTGERISGERLHALGRGQPPGRAGPGAGARRWRWPRRSRPGPTRPWRASRRCAAAPMCTRCEEQLEQEARFMVQSQGDRRVARRHRCLSGKTHADFAPLRKIRS